MPSAFKLGPFSKETGLINVVIETAKGSRNKYAYDEKVGLLTLRKVLPSGMVFPFDFGAIPGTRGEDGDPLDILVLMEEPVCAPCLVQAHLIGVIEGRQKEKGQTKRNDRLVATASCKNKPAEVESVKKLDPQLLKEIERFFISYNDLSGKEFKVMKYGGPKTALKLVQAGQKKYRAST